MNFFTSLSKACCEWYIEMCSLWWSSSICDTANDVLLLNISITLLLFSFFPLFQTALVKLLFHVASPVWCRILRGGRQCSSACIMDGRKVVYIHREGHRSIPPFQLCLYILYAHTSTTCSEKWFEGT